MRSIFIILLVSSYFLITQSASPFIRYVALGDSYTVCTGAEQSQAWPLVLSSHLKQNNIDIQLVENLAHNGWTTKDLIDKELPVFDQSKPDFVTLLIGANDWVQGSNEKEFRTNFIYILEHIQSQLPNKSNLLILTIPDFSVTPTGARYSYGRDASAGISSFNHIIKEEAGKRKLLIVDLFEKSKEMGSHTNLVAMDGLHPSAKEYRIWETLIYPVAYNILNK
ncbi:MAG TPA: SGNH/GDSL hydrolase family protein [Bacteroidia bacterium]|nr:SGNH/GDSL hydrolase family protein [Bacteroidia bacterium]